MSQSSDRGHEKFHRIGVTIGVIAFGLAVMLAFASGPAFWLESVVGGLVIAVAAYWFTRAIGWIIGGITSG